MNLKNWQVFEVPYKIPNYFVKKHEITVNIIGLQTL